MLELKILPIWSVVLRQTRFTRHRPHTSWGYHCQAWNLCSSTEFHKTVNINDKCKRVWHKKYWRSCSQLKNRQFWLTATQDLGCRCWLDSLTNQPVQKWVTGFSDRLYPSDLWWDSLASQPVQIRDRILWQELFVKKQAMYSQKTSNPFTTSTQFSTCVLLGCGLKCSTLCAPKTSLVPKSTMLSYWNTWNNLDLFNWRLHQTASYNGTLAVLSSVRLSWDMDS
jgi:hypothetical protein